MGKDYIIPKLLIWAKLFYGTDAKCFAKEKNGKYIFGTKRNKNIIDKPLAIYLAVGSAQVAQSTTIEKKQKVKRTRTKPTKRRRRK